VTASFTTPTSNAVTPLAQSKFNTVSVVIILMQSYILSYNKQSLSLNHCVSSMSRRVVVLSNMCNPPSEYALDVVHALFDGRSASPLNASRVFGIMPLLRVSFVNVAPSLSLNMITVFRRFAPRHALFLYSAVLWPEKPVVLLEAN